MQTPCTWAFWQAWSDKQARQRLLEFYNHSRWPAWPYPSEQGEPAKIRIIPEIETCKQMCKVEMLECIDELSLTFH